MKAMKGNDHAMMMMQNENHEMGEMKANKDTVEMNGNHQIMGNEHMIEMMKNNMGMMQKMMGNMMDVCEKDSAMRFTMVNMMTQHPEMMKAVMQKMNEKGMIKMDNMPGMENTGDEKELLHKH